MNLLQAYWIKAFISTIICLLHFYGHVKHSEILLIIEIYGAKVAIVVVFMVDGASIAPQNKCAVLCGQQPNDVIAKLCKICINLQKRVKEKYFLLINLHV